MWQYDPQDRSGSGIQIHTYLTFWIRIRHNNIGTVEEQSKCVLVVHKYYRNT
jgi:hypothetical protein